MAIKVLYKNGFTSSGVQDSNPIVPAIEDVVGFSQYPSQYPISDFIFWDETVKIDGGQSSGSARFMVDITKPTTTTTVHTGRVEQITYYPPIRNSEDYYMSISYRFSSDAIYDDLDEVLHQIHGDDNDPGSPIFSIRRRRGRLSFRIYMGGGSNEQARLDVGPATNEVWHHFIIRLKLREDSNGIITVWKDGQLARLYDPNSGNKWIVPESTLPLTLGYIAKTVIDDGQEVSVFDYRGITARVSPNNLKYFKWGLYKAAWSNRYDSNGDLLPGVYDPESPLYIEPGNREKTLWISNLKFELFDRVSNDVALRSLSPFGILPEDFPDWYVADEPVDITYPANNQNFALGSQINIETNITEGDVELIVNGNIVETKSTPPYSFSINNIPNNDSIIDLPFDGNLNQWGVSDIRAILTRPQNTSYVSGARGQAAALFNGQSGNINRSYITIPNEGLLSEIDNEFTISFWVKGPVGSGLTPYFLSSYSNNGGGIGLRAISSGLIDASLYNQNGDPIVLRSSVGFSEEEFRHFLLTYDGQWLKWYCNFEIDTELNVGLIDISASNDWIINASPVSETFSGTQDITIDDFRIYNYSISEEEIHKTVEDNYLGQLELKVRREGVESDPVTINIVESVDEYTVTVTQTTGGVVTGGGVYEDGSQATLTAIPDSGWTFVKWSDDTTENPYVFEVTGNVTLSAVFELVAPPEPTYFTVKGKFRIV